MERKTSERKTAHRWGAQAPSGKNHPHALRPEQSVRKIGQGKKRERTTWCGRLEAARPGPEAPPPSQVPLRAAPRPIGIWSKEYTIHRRRPLRAAPRPSAISSARSPRTQVQKLLLRRRARSVRPCDPAASESQFTSGSGICFFRPLRVPAPCGTTASSFLESNRSAWPRPARPAQPLQLHDLPAVPNERRREDLAP